MDLVSNLCSIIKNGYNLKLVAVKVPRSTLCVKILSLFYRLGFIKGFLINDQFKVTVYLKYINNKPSVRNITRISTPGKRVFMSVKAFKSIYKNKDNGFYIFSTSKGLLTEEEALLFNIGGEVILKVN